jgi:uncharacterized membrane protein
MSFEGLSFFEISLTVGVIFFITGIITAVFPPKKINHLYGYRTTRSMKNQSNWDIAQKTSSVKMIQGSILIIALSFLKSIFNFSENTNLIIGISIIIVGVVYIFYFTEKEIRKNEE